MRLPIEDIRTAKFPEGQKMTVDEVAEVVGPEFKEMNENPPDEVKKLRKDMEESMSSDLLPVERVAALSFKKEPIEVAVGYGAPQSVDALVNGVWGIHKALKGGMWAVTYVPEGKALGYTKSRKKAIEILTAILEHDPSLARASLSQVMGAGDFIQPLFSGRLPFASIMRAAGLSNLGDRYGKSGDHWGVPGGSMLIRVGARDLVLSSWSGYADYGKIKGTWGAVDIVPQKRMTRQNLDQWIKQVLQAPSTKALRSEIRRTAALLPVERAASEQEAEKLEAEAEANEAQANADRQKADAARMKESAGGLYGYTKGTQRDVEATIRKAQRQATKLAKALHGQDHQAMDFLRVHAKRANSKTARLLIALMQDYPQADLLPIEQIKQAEDTPMGMYGYPSGTARLALDACSALRSGIGEVAYNLHSRRMAKHERITGFLKEHSKAAKCGYTRLLLDTYPEAPRLAAKKASMSLADLKIELLEELDTFRDSEIAGGITVAVEAPDGHVYGIYSTDGMARKEVEAEINAARSLRDLDDPDMQSGAWSRRAKKKLPEELKEHQFTSEDNPNPKGNDRDGDGKTNEPSPVPAKGKKARSKGHHYLAPNGDMYVDTAFMNAMNKIPGTEMKHMGFGEFYAETPKGRVDFDRMRGKDFPGQSGRSHKLYGEGTAAHWLLDQMIRKRLTEEMGKVAMLRKAFVPDTVDGWLEWEDGTRIASKEEDNLLPIERQA